jgi:ribokinase
MGKIGADYWGRFLIERLRREGVDTSKMVVSPHVRTGVTYAIVEGAERSFITFRGGNASFSIQDIDLREVKADIVHIPSFFLLEALRPHYAELMNRARSRGALVSFDTGWDPFGLWRKTPHLMNALANADVFLPNLDEARKITGLTGADPKKLAFKLLRMGPKIVCIKMGPRGSLVSDGTRARRIPAFPVEVVDSTGAGDVYDAAFMLAYSKTRDVFSSARFASAAAAISVTGAGWERYPGFSDVNGFLRSRGYEPLNLE